MHERQIIPQQLLYEAIESISNKHRIWFFTLLSSAYKKYELKRRTPYRVKFDT